MSSRKHNNQRELYLLNSCSTYLGIYSLGLSRMKLYPIVINVAVSTGLISIYGRLALNSGHKANDPLSQWINGTEVKWKKSKLRTGPDPCLVYTTALIYIPRCLNQQYTPIWEADCRFSRIRIDLPVNQPRVGRSLVKWTVLIALALVEVDIIIHLSSNEYEFFQLNLIDLFRLQEYSSSFSDKLQDNSHWPLPFPRVTSGER